MKNLCLSLLFVAAVVTLRAGDAASVSYVPAATVASAFARGEPLIETSAYKIHASRREKPGLAEVHTTDTDIVHVIEGSATLVTGGRVVDGKAIAPNELRGASIASGETRRLVTGDVVVIPSGVPHQFLDVNAPLLYYVVKVTDGAGDRR